MTGNQVSAGWYGLIAAPIAAGILIAVWLIFAMVDAVEAMQRTLVPGTIELQLEADEYVLYAETQTVIDGKGYAFVEGGAGGCELVDASGRQVPLEARSSSTSYTFGSYQGKSFAEVDVPAAGRYVLSCEGGPGAVAIGGGIGAKLGLALAAGFGGILGGVVVGLLVRRARKRAR